MDLEIVSAWLQDVRDAENAAVKDHDCLPDLCFLSSPTKRTPNSKILPTMSRRSPRKKLTSTHNDDILEKDDISEKDDPSDEVFNTPRPTRRGVFTQMLQTSTLPSLTSARSPTRSTNSSTRSTSPVKGVDDLLRLEKPVQWNPVDMNDLQRKMQNCMPIGNTTAVPHFLQSLIGHLNYKYIPREMREILKQISPLESTLDLLFTDADTTTPTLSQSQSQSYIQFVIQPFGPQISNSGELVQAAQRLALLAEFTNLQSIVNKTNEFNTLSRSEAAWNEKVHGPMLDLAVLHTSNIAVENVTRANIARRFIPSSTTTYDAQFNGGMIDYALVLRPEPGLNERLLDFVSHLDYPTFNQTNYPPLRTWPTGIFVETKAKEHGQCIAEAKIQLGIWAASWFNRVARFPEKTPSSNTSSKPPLPFVPILLVDRGSWEVYFAFDDRSRYDICGPIEMGNTKSLKDAYRLLAGLRDLTQWMATEFRVWVELCLAEAESLY